MVRVEELTTPNAPVPRPLNSGFSRDLTYEVLAIDNPSESADCYFMLENDRHELWWICQKHLRLTPVNLQDLALTMGWDMTRNEE